MSLLYGRKVELYIDSRMYSGDELTIYFDIPFDDTAGANIAEVKIYNLSDSTIARLYKGARVILNAGYTGDVGAILLGVVKSQHTDWQEVDKVTTLQVVDGTENWFSMPYKRTFTKGVTAKTILTGMIADTGLAIGAFNLPTNYVYRSGKTINAKLKDAIKAVAKDCGAKAHVTRGKVFIRPKDEGDNIGFVIDADHGLISSPSPVEKEMDTGKKDKDGNAIKATVRGYKITTLLNHRVTTDALLKVSSRTANGTFRVDSGRQTSDGARFYTEMEVYPV